MHPNTMRVHSKNIKMVSKTIEMGRHKLVELEQMNFCRRLQPKIIEMHPNRARAYQRPVSNCTNAAKCRPKGSKCSLEPSGCSLNPSKWSVKLGKCTLK